MCTSRAGIETEWTNRTSPGRGAAAAPPSYQPERVVALQCRQVLEMYRHVLAVRRNNAGGFTDDRGHYVAMAPAGESDFIGQWTEAAPPHLRGRLFALETKRGGFMPPRRRDGRRSKAMHNIRWEKQIAFLRAVNANGGTGLWVRHAADLAGAIPKILAGARIAIDEAGWPWLET